MCSCDASRGSGELLLRSLLSAHTFACLCLIMFNGLRNAGRPRQILFSAINESTGSLYKVEIDLHSWLFRLTWQLMCACQEST